MSISARRTLFAVLGLAAVVAYVGWKTELVAPVAAPKGIASRVEAAPHAELVLPTAPREATAPRDEPPQAGEPRQEAKPSALGALEGRVLLDASFAGARCVAFLTADPSLEVVGKPTTVRVERDGRGRRVELGPPVEEPDGDEVARTYTSEPLSGPEFELVFTDLLPGAYELRLSVVQKDYPEDPIAILAAQQEPLYIVARLIVAPDETLRDPRLDPLDLRSLFVRAQFTLVDAFGVSRASVDCRAVATLAARALASTDADGNIDFVLESPADLVELELLRHGACIVRAPLVPGRSVVVIPARPVYVLHVEPELVPDGFELSVFVRESSALAGDSPLGRGAVWSRFDATGDAVVAPRRVGLHELEWRVKKPDGTSASTLDPDQSLDVRAATDAQYVALELPAAVRAALR